MKKIISLILCLCFITAVFSFSTSAEIVNEGHITIGTTPAVTGDTVTIPIKISENPGIMATTISITYNSKSLEFIDYIEGTFLKDYTVVDHPDKNLIRFVSCEAKTRKNNGTMLSLRFKVRDNAEWEFSKIDIKYSQGDFCNWALDKIMPTVTSGGVDIAYNGSNCSHKNYNDWKTVAEPTCDSEGVMERICQKCNHVDSKRISSVGHIFPEEWTVENVATKDKAGTMVRYCTTCNEFVDRIEYTIEDSEKGDFENEIGADIPKNEIIEEIFKEQNPDKEFSPVNPPLSSKPDSSSQSDTSSDSSAQKNPSVSDVIDSLLGEDSDGDSNSQDTQKQTIKQKIAEVFPNYTTIEKYLKIALMILVLIIVM